jgi:hypothetical protein
MSRWERVQGDVDDTITVTLGGIADLDDVTAVEAHVWTTSERETLSAAVADSAARTILVQLGDANGWLASATAATWLAEWQLTFADGSVKTWPAGKPDEIKVRADGDPTP